MNLGDVIGDFRMELIANSIPLAGEILADGKLHRYKTEGDSEANCWYVLHGDGRPAGSFGCWKRGISQKWCYQNGEVTPPDPETKRRWREAEQARETEERDRMQRVSKLITEKAGALPKAGYSNDYLSRKQVTAYGNILEDDDGSLFLPLRDIDGVIWSCQRINQDGSKRYAAGGRIQGCFFPICDRQDGPVIICEGYATGASVYQATGWSTYCAMDCGNLIHVATAIRSKFKDRTILIAADNDKWDKKTGELRPENPGLAAAKAAAKATNASVVIPEFHDTDKSSTDFNDLAVTAGLEAVLAKFEKAVPCPLSVLSFDEISLVHLSDNDKLLGDNMLNCAGNMTILGQGGVGKTRFIYQMLYSFICGHERFFTWDIHPGARNFKWLILQQENSVRRLQFMREALKKSMTPQQWYKFNLLVRVLTPMNETDCFLNLDNPDNVRRIEKAIDYHLPDGIIFDSLYDFSVGDLNKDADMKATLTACSRLARYRNPRRPLVMLHHAGIGQSGASRAVGYDRASFARNSKVIHSWSRCQINIAPMSDEDNSQLAISCGKLSDGKEFHPFSVILNEETMLYEVDSSIDVAEWAKNLKSGKKEPEITSDGVMALTSPATPKSELAKTIMEQIGCNRQSAYRHIRTALFKKKIIERDGKLFKA